MDYGHTGQINGAGANPVDTDNFEAKNNPERINKSISQEDPLVNRDLRNMGGSAISSMETSSHQGDIPSSPELGKIIDLEMPPNASELKAKDSSEIAENSLNAGLILDLESFRAEKDKISPKTLKNVEQVVNEFDKNRISPAELDDARWEASRAYKDSFKKDVEGDMVA